VVAAETTASVVAMALRRHDGGTLGTLRDRDQGDNGILSWPHHALRQPRQRVKLLVRGLVVGASCRAQLAFLSNPFVPLVQIPDLIFELAILTLRKEPGNLVNAERRVPTMRGWPIIYTLSDAEFAS
jgi:hypothetical protein